MSLPPDIWRKIILEDLSVYDRGTIVAASRVCRWWFRLFLWRRRMFSHENRCDARHYIGNYQAYGMHQTFMNKDMISFLRYPQRPHTRGLFDHKHTLTLYISGKLYVQYHFGYKGEYKRMTGFFANRKLKEYSVCQPFRENHYVFDRAHFKEYVSPDDITTFENLWKYVMGVPGFIATLTQQ